MKRKRAGALLLAMAAVMLAPTGAAAAGRPVPAEAKDITVKGSELTLVVSVKDLAVGDQLNPAGVRVTVSGKDWPATAKTVGGAKSTVPRTAVLVVDTSGSMGTAGIADAQAASRRFLSVVPPDVAVGLVTFASQAQLAVAPTKRRQAVVSALTRMRPAGQTRLYDAIDVALKALGTRGDRALILLSDGKDTASTATLADVSGRLRSSGISSDLVAFRTEGGQVDILTELARRTNGRVREVATGNQLSDVFASAARTLVNQVVVTVSVPKEAVAGTTEAVVQIPAGSGTAVATARFEIPSAAARGGEDGSATASRPIVTEAGISWFLPIVIGGCFLCLFLIFGLALTPATWQQDRSMLRVKEMQRYGLGGAGGVRWTPSDDRVGSASQTALAWADRAVQARGLENTWSTKLDRAGLPLRPKEWLIIRLGVALAATALGVLLLPWWVLTGPLMGLCGWLLTGAYVRVKATRRLGRFADSLPDVLQLIAGSLRSGFSLPQAVDNAAKDGQEPIAGEFSRALAESQLGVPLEDALDRVADRMASTDLSWTVMAIRIAREVGGNLAEVLLATAETMRERGRIKRQVRVLSAEGRLSAYVLIGLPVGITVFMLMFRRSYIAPLITDPIGWVMTGYALLSVIVGAWWMSRLIKLEV